jgi:hypothetical protein
MLLCTTRRGVYRVYVLHGKGPVVGHFDFSRSSLLVGTSSLVPVHDACKFLLSSSGQCQRFHGCSSQRWNWQKSLRAQNLR